MREYKKSILIAGGIYGNWEAFESLLEVGKALSIPPERFIITGDLLAYCADGNKVIESCRLQNTLFIRGNCERTLSEKYDDCGCGFTSGSHCERLSFAWYAHAKKSISQTNKEWALKLPEKEYIYFANRTLVVCHAEPTSDNRFIFRSTSGKSDILKTMDCDGIIAGHSGIPFTEQIEDKIWHNSGALGMPANDGTNRTWYSIWEETHDGRIQIQHCALNYDTKKTAKRMEIVGLPLDYQLCLESGIWPSDSVLPPPEKKSQGQPLSFTPLIW